jgi:hypothetical protein
MPTHYTAIVEVKRTIEIPEERDQYDKIKVQGHRGVSDVAHVVVRAFTLEELVVKVHAHVELLAPAPRYEVDGTSGQVIHP